MSDKHWAVYIRRSVVREGDPNVSIGSQLETARRRVPPNASIEEFVDGGVGHHSGTSTEGRPEYRRMLEWLEAGRLAGIAAYDESRLNRNADEQIRLFKRCAARGVLLRTDDNTLTAEQMYDDGGGVKLTTLVKAGAAEFLIDQQRKKVRNLAAHIHQSGGIWARTPFGYRTVRNPDTGRVEHVNKVVREIAIVDEEAAVVRTVFSLLPTCSFSEIARTLNTSGAHHRDPRPWTTAAIKDLWRRREFYRGMVTRKRGLDPRPGMHEPIITEDEYRDAVAGVERRKRYKGPKPSYAKRTYVLRGSSTTPAGRGCAATLGSLGDASGATTAARLPRDAHPTCWPTTGRLSRATSGGSLPTRPSTSCWTRSRRRSSLTRRLN